jgi:hypothetical protein
VHNIAEKKRSGYREDRLDMMMANRMEKYRNMVKAHLTEGMNKKQGVMKCFLRRLAIPAAAWTSSATKFNSDQEAKEKLQVATLECEEILYKPDFNKPLLSREKVLEVVRTMEIDKQKLANRLTMAVKHGQVSGANVPFIMEVDRL